MVVVRVVVTVMNLYCSKSLVSPHSGGGDNDSDGDAW